MSSAQRFVLIIRKDKDDKLSCTKLKSVLSLKVGFKSDMEKGADTRTLSAEIFETCGNFWIWKIDYSYFGIKLINCENFFLNIKYLAYL